MTVYVTGASGRLGLALMGYGYVPSRFLVESSFEVHSALWDTEPSDVLIHCAAITDVDACDAILVRRCRQVNGIGTALVREYFRGNIIYLSTDFVFDGKNGPYSETAPTNPVNNYGMSKLMGEDAIFNKNHIGDIIVRTTMLYGGDNNKPDFVDWVVRNLEYGEPFEVYMNEFTTPTYVPHLAKAIKHLVDHQLVNHQFHPTFPRIMNVVGSDWISKYEFALMIANVFELNSSLIKPARSNRKIATRPLKAGLKTNLARTMGVPIFSVLEGLEACREHSSYHNPVPE